jgi:signal transduction histidine kinase
MKTRTLIWIISLAAALVFLVLSMVFKSAISSKNELLLKEEYSHLRQETGKVYSMKTVALEQYVFDNSYWDELMVAVNKRDTAWIHSKIVPSMKNFEISQFWMLDATGRECFFYDDAKETRAPMFDVPLEKLLPALKTNPFRTFHVNYNGKLIQVVSAPIQNGDDVTRVTPHQGYYIAGRIFDQGYAEKLNKLAETTKFLVLDAASTPTDTINRKTNLIHYYYPLIDFSGKTIASIGSEKKLNYISVYSEYINIYLWVYLGILGIVLFSFYQFLRIRVLNPLASLSVALQKKDAANLKYLAPRKDEFSDFAGLVEDSFEKTTLLQKEVEARKESEAALKKSANELEKATVEKIRAEQDRLAKSEFLSTMSHEIRTPINGVIGIANLLKDEPLSPQQSELVDTLIFSSNHLLSILTDILDLSKIEAGNIRFDRVSFNLTDICNSVQNLYTPKAKEKNIELFVLSDNRIGGYLLGDSVRICQVLNNLVSNAIKFTEEGNVTLSYRMVCDDGFKQTIEFTVQDTGIGIPADKLDTIFESFSQANRSINTNYGGTGLGLTITKKIIELQGGKISVSSKPGKGSVFTIFLSFDKLAADGEAPVIPQKKSKNGSLSGLRVLVAEDNKINAMVLGKFLDKWNVTMQVAVNGQEAVKKLETEHFDLVLMDLHMPVMDGMEATYHIRNAACETISKIPVIALTADATSETQKYILENGFDHYLSKPFNPDNLYRLLEQYRQ